MTSKVGDYVLDNGLQALDTMATHIHMVDGDPDTFAQVALVTCGNKDCGGGGAFGAISPGVGFVGRQVMSVQINDGMVTRSTTAIGWAVTDTPNSRLLANGRLNATQGVISGNTFQLPPFVVGLPSGG
jgi:hypothetical protein